MVVYTPVAEDPAVAELHAHVEHLGAQGAVDALHGYVDQLTAPPAGHQVDASSRAAFVGSLLPVAQAYAEKTGIPAEAYIAMAASESNWGKAGSLFGIKGPGATYATHEVVGGQSVPTSASFTTYPSIEAAFQDFTRLTTAGRYAPAWQQFQQTGDWRSFLGNITRAGYATDPAWGSKVAKLATSTIAPLTGHEITDAAGNPIRGTDDLTVRPGDAAAAASSPLTGHEIRDQRGTPIRGTDDLTVRPWDPPSQAVPLAEERGAILGRAKDYLGTPYQWGGTTKQGIDCSAFISEAWGLPRQTTDTLAKVATPIAPTQLEPGDALNLTTQQDPRGYGHVRMFAGWADPAHRTMAVYESSSTTGGVVQRVIPYDPAYTPMRLNTLAAAAPGPTGPTAADLGSRDDWRHASRAPAAATRASTGFTPDQPGAGALDRGDMYGSGLLGGDQAAVDPQVDWAKLFPAPPVLPLIRSPEQDAGTLSTDVQPYSGPFAGLLDPAKFRAGGVDAAFTPGM